MLFVCSYLKRLSTCIQSWKICQCFHFTSSLHHLGQLSQYFCVESFGKEMKFVQIVLVHLPRWQSCLYMVMHQEIGSTKFVHITVLGWPFNHKCQFHSISPLKPKRVWLFFQTFESLCLSRLPADLRNSNLEWNGDNLVNIFLIMSKNICRHSKAKEIKGSGPNLNLAKIWLPVLVFVHVRFSGSYHGIRWKDCASHYTFRYNSNRKQSIIYWSWSTDFDLMANFPRSRREVGASVDYGHSSQLAFYVNLHRAVIGPSATLTGRWRPDIDLCRMLTGFMLFSLHLTYLKDESIVD